MKNQLYDDIYNFLSKEITPKNFNKIIFFDYLIDNDNFILIDIIDHITNSKDKQKKFLQSLDSYRNKIINLYKKHSIPLNDNTDTRTLLLELFKYCKNIRSFYPTPNHQFKSRPSTITATIGRETHMNDLEKLLEQYHKVILWGGHGCGKTRFVQYCLYKWKKADYCHVNYSQNLSITLRQATYIDYWETSHSVDISDLSKYNFLTSLLIIDNMCFSSNAADDIKELARLNANIIVIATDRTDMDTFYSYELPQLSDDNLISIFETESNLELDIPHQEQLLTKTWRNPLFLSLIAKQCRHQKATIITLNNILQQLDKPARNMKLKIFKHPHNNIPVNFMGHIKYVYKIILGNSKFDNKDQLVQQLKYLCCFGCSPVPLSFISCVFPDYNKIHFDILNKIGLIECSDENVQVPPLIFYAVLFTEKFELDKQDFKIIVDNLKRFLLLFDTELSVPYLSSLLLSFAQTHYNKIPAAYNPNQKKTSKYFENWQNVLSLIFRYYNQSGDFLMAREIVSLIHYPNDLQNRHSPLDKAFLELANMINLYPESPSGDITAKIDTLCLSLYTNPIAFINITDLLINSYDDIIKRYCNLFYSSIMKPDNFFEEEQKHLTNTLGMLISQMFKVLGSKARNLLFSNLVNLKERLSYYEGCHSLMAMPIIPPEFLHQCCLELRKWKNTNYRIRSIAFTVFTHNFYIFKNWFTNYDLVKTELLPKFKSVIIPEIKFISEQIHNCKLIPYQTSYICLCSYISSALIQYTFLSEESENFSFDFYNCLRELINRSVLSKEDIVTAMTYIDKISSFTKQKQAD